MKYDRARTGITIRNPESRNNAEIPADLIVEEGKVRHGALVNFSRHGARLLVSGHYDFGQVFRLEVAGWPTLDGRVVWSEKGRVGCLFENPPSQKAFTMMCACATACDREGAGRRFA